MEKSIHLNDGDTNRSIFGHVLLFCYILSAYIAQPPFMSSKINSLLLYALIGFTFLKIISELKRFNIRLYTYWYLAIIFYAAMTYLFATDPGVVIESSYNLIVILILTFVSTYYLNDSIDFHNVIHYFAFSGMALSILMFANGLIISDVRLGEEFFGNANAFASIIAISEFCLIWLFFYGSRRLKFIYIIGVVVMFYLLLLSGGRKFILVSLLFVYIQIVLKYYKSQKNKLISRTVIFFGVLVVVYFIVFEYQPIYDIVGIRFEGLINAITGYGEIDASSLRRKQMIEFGVFSFKQQPLLGYGLDNYKVLQFMNGGFYSYAHNNYIELLVDLGLLGFLLYYGYYIYIIYKLLNIRNDHTGLRDFFLGIALVLLINDYGAVTYNLIQIQLLLAFAGSYIWLEQRYKFDS